MVAHVGLLYQQTNVIVEERKGKIPVTDRSRHLRHIKRVEMKKMESGLKHPIHQVFRGSRLNHITIESYLVGSLSATNKRGNWQVDSRQRLSRWFGFK